MSSRETLVRLDDRVVVEPRVAVDVAAAAAEGVASWRRRGVSVPADSLAAIRVFSELARAIAAHDVEGVGGFRSSGIGTDAEPSSVTVATMTTNRIALRAGVSDRYVRRLCRDGVLHPYASKTAAGYLVERVAVDRWLEGRKAS